MEIETTASRTRAALSACRWPLFALLALLAATAAHAGRAESLSPTGCPVFHCTVEATGALNEAVVPSVLVATSSSALGFMLAQGCSGNGTVLACLFATDTATGSAAGTLKMIDATTLQPLWGSAGTSGSYNPIALGASVGQVPDFFSDGTIAAGDQFNYVHYSRVGAVLGTLPLDQSGADFGLTPLNATYGIVSQADGVLTLVDMTTWTAVSSLTLRDPVTHASIKLVSPSAGGPGVLYAVGYVSRSNTGWLFSVGIDTLQKTLKVNSAYQFSGQSGASPVVVLPSVSGLPNNLVLLPTPGINGKPAGQNFLAALEDEPGTGLTLAWSIPTTAALLFAPTVDPVSGSLFYDVSGAPVVYQAALTSGAPVASFNLQTIGGFASQFSLNGHLAASISGSTLTLLLGANETPSGGPTTQYALAFQPLVAPTTLLWSYPLASTTATTNVYTAAWNIAPSTFSNVGCPIVIAVSGAGSSPIVRLCDH
jgi:hypothetical protein